MSLEIGVRSPHRARHAKRQAHTTSKKAAAAREDAADPKTSASRKKAAATSAVDDAPAAATPAATTLTPAAATVVNPIAIASHTSDANVVQTTSTLFPSASSAASTSTSHGLSTGALAGIIAAAVLLALAAVAFLVFGLVKRRRNAAANGGYGSPMKDAGLRALKKRSSFGNTGMPPIYAAMSNGNRAGSDADEKELLSNGSGHSNTLIGDGLGYNDKDAQPYNPPAHTPQHLYTMPPPQQPKFAPASKQTESMYNPIAAAAPNQPAQVPAPVAAPNSGDQSEIFVVRRTFEPSLPDELVLFVGDRVNILQAFDDGWCLGANLSSAAPGQDPQRGVFPRDCVEPLEPAQPGANLQRVPTLPPLDLGSKRKSQETGDYFGQMGAPAIQVSGPEAHGELLSQFPAPGSRASMPQGKRTSSLLADRDAQLFVALGNALDTNQPPAPTR